MILRALQLLLVGSLVFALGATARANNLKNEKLVEAIKELKEAKKFLEVKDKHDQVKKAHVAVQEAIKEVKESKEEYGGRRVRLLERLELVEKKLDTDHVNAEKALDEALEDLEFAVKN
ncbi:hypothetical protein [Fimbriiglobus ruber]|uniref:Uncharacterized protein n=1 Tax=Fimbriiglobus ruber TaxID=1908690 RepID=A0A225DRL7_9BACT|nr:hypothetical protein [Fimbriiglobus ruber]OWK41258.1 hypothetical protein FRUB_04621 [Fimbriiglobus ruber]